MTMNNRNLSPLFLRKKRSPLEIVYDLLKLLRKSGGKMYYTPLMSRNNLNADTMSRVMVKLESGGLINNLKGEWHRVVILTEEGYDYLSILDKFMRMLEVV